MATPTISSLAGWLTLDRATHTASFLGLSSPDIIYNTRVAMTLGAVLGTYTPQQPALLLFNFLYLHSNSKPIIESPNNPSYTIHPRIIHCHALQSGRVASAMPRRMQKAKATGRSRTQHNDTAHALSAPLVCNAALSNLYMLTFVNPAPQRTQEGPQVLVVKAFQAEYG